MTQRRAKVESLLQHQVAANLVELLPNYRAQVTVTGVDVAADLKNATIWLSVLPTGNTDEAEIIAEIDGIRAEVQERVATYMATKFVPRLAFKVDRGVEYAEHIERVLKEL
jgi:ribosome-binding factor A